MARVTEESLAGQIRALSPGQSFSRSVRIAIEDADAKAVTASLSRLRNLVNGAVGRLRKEEPGSNFRVEGATGITDDKQALIATVAVTNMDEATGDDDDDDEVDI